MSLFPKDLWPFNYLTLAQNKPLEFFKCYLLFDHFCLTWLMSFVYTPCNPMQIKPNKSPLRKRLLALLLWGISHLSSPADNVLVDLFSSMADGGWLLQTESPHRKENINVWVPAMCPEIQACVLTGNWTGRPFASQVGAQSTEPHQSGLVNYILTSLELAKPIRFGSGTTHLVIAESAKYRATS